MEVYQFSCLADDSCFGISADYYYFVIVGQLDNKSWISVTSTVPKETPDFNHVVTAEDNTKVSPPQPNNDLEFQINQILQSLTPVLTYGHYDGCYYRSFHHQILYQ